MNTPHFPAFTLEHYCTHSEYYLEIYDAEHK